MFNKKYNIVIMCSIFLFMISFVSSIPEQITSPINHLINYSEIVANVSSNNSVYWDGNAWSDVRWLDIDGGNANGDIDIDAYSFTTTGNINSSNMAFEKVGNLIKQKNADYDEDFVVGSPQLDDDGDTSHDSRMFFNKSNGAFRSGIVHGNEWDNGNVGDYSFATGWDTIASGQGSVAMGLGSNASGLYSIAMGGAFIGVHEALGIGSIVLGLNNLASGIGSIGMGARVSSTQNYATSIGRDFVNNIVDSFAVGFNEIDLLITSGLANFQDTNITTTENISANYFFGNGSQLTGVTEDNSSWNESHANTLYTNQTYVDNQGFAKYQFTNNNFNGSGNLTTTGTATINGIKIDAPIESSNLIVGNGAGASMTTGADTNTFVGTNAGASLTGSNYNSYFGYDAGRYNTGQGNTGLGKNTLRGVSGSSTGGNNVAIGDSAGKSITTGFSNMFLGYWAGYSVTTNSNNVHVGVRAGQYATGEANVLFGTSAGKGDSATTPFTGNENVAIGYKSMYEPTSSRRNTMLGYYTGNAITTGQYNLIAGYRAGDDLTEGNENILLGNQVGYTLTTGDRNIFIGSKAGYRQTTNSNLLIIDNRARADTATELSNSIIYGIMADTPEVQDLFLNADVHQKSDISKKYFGASDDKFITVNDTGMFLGTNVGDTPFFFDNDVEIDGDLDVVGNFTGNQYHAQAYYHNVSSIEIDFAVQDKWYNLTFDNTDKINGFTSIENHTLLVNVAGRYLVNYRATGSGQNNHMYASVVSINLVPENCTVAGKKMSAGGDVTTLSGTGIIDLNVNDLVNLRMKDHTGTGTGDYYGMNLNLVRIGS